jgi:hypothetical protein
MITIITVHRCLRVLVLAQYFPPDMSGSSTRASNDVKRLRTLFPAGLIDLPLFLKNNKLWSDGIGAG